MDSFNMFRCGGESDARSGLRGFRRTEAIVLDASLCGHAICESWSGDPRLRRHLLRASRIAGAKRLGAPRNYARMRRAATPQTCAHSSAGFGALRNIAADATFECVTWNVT
jgi:hypothetical protein